MHRVDYPFWGRTTGYEQHILPLHHSVVWLLLRRSTGRPTPSHVASTERWLLLDCVDRDVVDRLRRSNFGPLATPHQLYPGNWAQPRLTVLHTTIFWLDSTAEERSSSSLRPTATTTAPTTTRVATLDVYCLCSSLPHRGSQPATSPLFWTRET